MWIGNGVVYKAIDGDTVIRKYFTRKIFRTLEINFVPTTPYRSNMYTLYTAMEIFM